MSICADFLNKKAVMQPQIETNIGVEVMLTPKCHADIAGWREVTEGERGRAISWQVLGHVHQRKSYTSSFDIKYSSSIHRKVICSSGEVEYKRDCVGELGILVVILREYGGRTKLP